MSEQAYLKPVDNARHNSDADTRPTQTWGCTVSMTSEVKENSILPFVHSRPYSELRKGVLHGCGHRTIVVISCRALNWLFAHRHVLFERTTVTLLSIEDLNVIFRCYFVTHHRPHSNIPCLALENRGP